MDPRALTAWESGSRPARRPAIMEPCPRWTRSILSALSGPLAEQLARVAEYREAGLLLQRRLRHRKAPLEGAELRRQERRVWDRLEEELGPQARYSGPGDPALEEASGAVRGRIKVLRKKYLHHWAPVEFDETASLAYLVTRGAGEFAALKYIFDEVKQQMPDYQPRTFFDFGSGVTSGLWAVRDSFGEVTEAFCVDPSKQMNDLARLVLAEGADRPELPAGISFRLHLPARTALQYQLVLSSHSLLELPSAQDRLAAVHSLWSRVEAGGVLVLVEAGTNVGFQLVTEARDYLLQLAQLAARGEAEPGLAGHVVAPCPHDGPCPRFLHDSIPCSFSLRHSGFPLPGLQPEVSKETFSYLALRKGERESDAFPRLVEEPVKTKGCVYCRLCTAGGQLQEVMARRKQEPSLFQLAARLPAGGRLPVTLRPWREEDRVGTPWMKRKAAAKEESSEKNLADEIS